MAGGTFLMVGYVHYIDWHTDADLDIFTEYKHFEYRCLLLLADCQSRQMSRYCHDAYPLYHRAA
jgi:hypothetical protein